MMNRTELLGPIPQQEALSIYLRAEEMGTLFFSKLISGCILKRSDLQFRPDSCGMQCLFTTSVNKSLHFSPIWMWKTAGLVKAVPLKQKHKLKHTLLAKNSSRGHDMIQLTDLLGAGIIPAAFLPQIADVIKH